MINKFAELATFFSNQASGLLKASLHRFRRLAFREAEETFEFWCKKLATAPKFNELGLEIGAGDSKPDDHGDGNKLLALLRPRTPR